MPTRRVSTIAVWVHTVGKIHLHITTRITFLLLAPSRDDYVKWSCRCPEKYVLSIIVQSVQFHSHNENFLYRVSLCIILGNIEPILAAWWT